MITKRFPFETKRFAVSKFKLADPPIFKSPDRTKTELPEFTKPLELPRGGKKITSLEETHTSSQSSLPFISRLRLNIEIRPFDLHSNLALPVIRAPLPLTLRIDWSTTNWEVSEATKSPSLNWQTVVLRSVNFPEETKEKNFQSYNTAMHFFSNSPKEAAPPLRVRVEEVTVTLLVPPTVRFPFTTSKMETSITRFESPKVPRVPPER